MAVAPHPPHTPLDDYVARLDLDECELEELLATIDDRLTDAPAERRRLLLPCRAAVLDELRTR